MTDDTGPRPEIPYWHLWTDAGGVSHQTRCALTEFELKGVGRAAPQWNNKQDRVEATVVYTVQPVGWVGDWHENPAAQWIVVLSGRWWVNPWTARASNKAPGSFRWARIRAVRRRMGARVTAPGRSGTRRPC